MLVPAINSVIKMIMALDAVASLVRPRPHATAAAKGRAKRELAAHIGELRNRLHRAMMLGWLESASPSHRRPGLGVAGGWVRAHPARCAPSTWCAPLISAGRWS